MEDEPQERAHTQQVHGLCFANVFMYPEKPGTTGKFKKFQRADRRDRVGNSGPVPKLGRLRWVTDGGLGVLWRSAGDFRAVDRKTGKILLAASPGFRRHR